MAYIVEVLGNYRNPPDDGFDRLRPPAKRKEKQFDYLSNEVPEKEEPGGMDYGDEGDEGDGD